MFKITEIHLRLKWESKKIFLRSSSYLMLNVELVHRKLSFRYGFTSKLLTIVRILNSAVEDLFCKIQLTNHCVHPLLSPDKTLSHMLRARGHVFQLPTCMYNLHKKSFVISCLFKFLAWLCFSWCLILSILTPRKLPFPIDLLRRPYNSVRTAVQYCDSCFTIVNIVFQHIRILT